MLSFIGALFGGSFDKFDCPTHPQSNNAVTQLHPEQQQNAEYEAIASSNLAQVGSDVINGKQNTFSQSKIPDPGRACASEIVSSILEQIVSEAVTTLQEKHKADSTIETFDPGRVQATEIVSSILHEVISDIVLSKQDAVELQ